MPAKGHLLVQLVMLLLIPNGMDVLPEATEDEEDMLDLAFGLTHTSRLGCQVIMTPELDGLKIMLPAATRNMMLKGDQ